MFPRRGSYTGRLTFDPETGFHTDSRGRKVVTFDNGISWRYARRHDLSHNARYAITPVVVDSTANATDPEPHHFQVQPDDAHTGWVGFHPDAQAPTVTSHTEAWK